MEEETTSYDKSYKKSRALSNGIVKSLKAQNFPYPDAAVGLCMACVDYCISAGMSEKVFKELLQTMWKAYLGDVASKKRKLEI